MSSESALQKKLGGFNIILASKSPRRKQLMEGLGIPFVIKTKEVDESFPAHLRREEIPLYLCLKKADAFKKELKNKTIIITSDTIVWMNNQAVNKPGDRAEAIEMLKTLSGKKHTVYTAVCLKSASRTRSFFDVTEVYFKKLTLEEIHFYVENFRPYDKAGAYGAQEFIGFIGIKKIVGSYFNVMGFPVKKVYEELLRF